MNGKKGSHCGDGDDFNSPGFKVSEVRGVTVDAAGNVLITEHDAGFVRRAWCGAPAGPEWPGHPLSPRRPAVQAATDSRMARALRSRSLQVLHLVPQLHQLLADRPLVALAGVLLRAEEQIGAGSAEPSSRSRRNGPCAAASLA